MMAGKAVSRACYVLIVTCVSPWRIRVRMPCCLDIGFRHMFFRPPGFGRLPLQVLQPTQSRLIIIFISSKNCDIYV